MIRPASIALVSCFLLAAAKAQAVDLAASIEQLASPADRARARSSLLALGAAAAAPLAARWPTASDEHAIVCLAVLAELGPAAGAAVPTLMDQLKGCSKRGHGARALQLWTTLAELVPYGPDGCELSRRQQEEIYYHMDGSGPAIQMGFAKAFARLKVRSQLPRGQDSDAILLQLGTDARPWVIELAIQRLGALGPAAARAVPSLRAVLDRPEPRVLPLNEAVPLHRLAATAILQIAPQAPAASAAVAVLAGRWESPVPPPRPVPERAMRRIEELVGELRQPGGRHGSAIDNLVALGALAAGPVAELLAPECDPAAIAAALTVLQGMGCDAMATVPALATALMALPTQHTGAVLRALATTAPWSDHVLVGPNVARLGDRLRIDGHPLDGTIDDESFEAIRMALEELGVAQIVPVRGDPDLLRPLLAHAVVRYRRRAIQVASVRGPDCVGLLTDLAAMLTKAQPLDHRLVFGGEGGMRSTAVDITDEIQRLCATAILRVAPTGHPLLAVARERLNLPPAK